MLKANIEAQIESLKNERKIIWDEIIRQNKLIDKLKQRQNELLDQESDLYYKIEELEEQMNE